MNFTPIFCEFSFDGGFEDSGFVALEVGLDALEIGDGFVEAGELFFDLRDDLLLLSWWSYGHQQLRKFFAVYVRLAYSSLIRTDLLPILWRLKKVRDIFGVN